MSFEALTNSAGIRRCCRSTSGTQLRGARDIFPEILFPYNFLNSTALRGSDEDFAGDVGRARVSREASFEALHGV